jgi:microcystin-dependent protein
LFMLLWTNINNTYAPVSSGRGASAAADWAAHKTIQLTRQLGRSLTIAGAGSGLTAAVLGQYDGAETHAITLAEIPPHAHNVSAQSSGAVGGDVAQGSSGGDFAFPTSSAGSGAAMSLIQPRALWNIMIKL